MRILYGITKSNFGGAQRYVFDLALDAKRLGHEVSVICGGEGTLVDKLREADIDVYNMSNFGRDFSPIRDLYGLFYFFGVLRNFKPDVLHINSAKMGGAGIFLGRLLRIKKIIFTAHGWAWNENRSWLSKLIIKKLSWLTILGSHKTIAVSEAVYKGISSWPLTKRRMSVIRNGVREFALMNRDAARNKLGVNANELVIGTVSELHHIKGLDFLIEAWSNFKKSRDGKLVIVGAGDEEESLKAQAKRLGVDESVIFKGFVDDARSLLKGFDVFTLTSRSEGLPYALLEAGSANLPIIASRVGGIPEIIDGNSTGLLIEVGDTKQLENYLNELSDSIDMRNSLGTSLHNKIEKEFTLEKMVRDTLELYA